MKKNNNNLVTILECNTYQNKSWYLNESLEYELLDKNFSKYYNFNEIAILDIYDLHALVEKYSWKRNCCFARGKITEDAYNIKTKGYKIRRLVNEKIEEGITYKSTIIDYPKNWIMLDIDNFKTPDNCKLQIKSHRELAVENFIQTLHESFHDSSYVCQFSNGMFLNSKKIKAHLWFMLDEAYDGKTLKPWFEKHCEGVDKCIFRPAQILYTANPIFVNSRDPLKGKRIYLKEKNNKTVILPKKEIIKEYLIKEDN
tara:strand:+ start:253 stop:1020 length:768 start_codon:yes stop_codon:yes gene_type:complete